MDEKQLLKGCLINDATAQKKLFERFSPKMMGVCFRYAQDEDEAKDFLQDGFIKVFDKLDSFQGMGSLEGWIRRVIVNTCLEHIRKKKNFKNTVDVSEVESQMKSEESISGKLQREDLLNLIKKLPLGFRTVFNMYAIEGYSHKEIADALGVSENTSKSQYSRAKAQLRKWLEGVEIY